MEEAAFLIAMDGIVRRVEIEDDPSGRHCVALEKDADKQPLHRIFIYAQLAIAVIFCPWRMLKPVERRLSRQNRAILTAGLKLARDKAEHWIVAQLVVIVQVFVAKRNAMNTLSHQPETGRHLPRKANAAISLAQKQRARVRGHRAAIERRCDFPSTETGEIERIPATLRPHRASPLLQPKPLLQKNFR
jgi:hypothetical protein